MREYLFELHTHTKETSRCSKIFASDLIRIHHELGYDGICITDHFYGGFFEELGKLPWGEKVDSYLRGFRTAREEGKKYGITVLLGMEYCIPNTEDDILIYGFDEAFLYRHENLHLLDEWALKKLAEQNDLLLIQAHPFRKMVSKTYDNIVEGFEIFNSHPRHDSMDEKAEEHASGFGGIKISGSDVHRPEDIGRSGVYLPEAPKDSFELAEILRKIKTPRLNRQPL